MIEFLSVVHCYWAFMALGQPSQFDGLAQIQSEKYRKLLSKHRLVIGHFSGRLDGRNLEK